MHHFAVALRGRAFTSPEIQHALEEFVSTRLCFKPERAVATNRDGVAIVSFEVNRAAFGVQARTYFSASSSTLIFGVITFENFSSRVQSIARSNPARAMHEVLTTYSAEECYQNLGGSYSVVHVKLGSVVAFSSFDGYGSLYAYRSKDLLVIGSKASLVYAFVPRQDRSLNLLAASWLYSCSMVLGEDTVYGGVRRLPAGRLVSGTVERLQETILRPSFFLPPTCADQGALNQAVDRLARRVHYYLHLPVQWNSHITGGKDSRAVLALLHACGALKKVTRFVTQGSEDNGDVIIARELAKSLCLTNHVVQASSKKSEWSDHELAVQYERFYYSPWRYDGQLTPWDGAGPKAAAKRPNHVTFMGGGGEVYRQKDIVFDTSNKSECVNKFANWYYDFNALGLVHQDVAYWQRNCLSGFVETSIERGSTNLQTSLYVEHRLSNWGAAHYQNNSSPAVASLLDLELARFTQTSNNCGDDIHYFIIARACPQLLEVPLLNFWWSGATAQRAQSAGTPKNVLEVAVRKNFPWQYELAEKYWEGIIGEILDGAAALQGTIDNHALQRLLTCKESVKRNSATLKMLFGLRSIIALANGEERGEPDFMSESYSISSIGDDDIDLQGILKRKFPRSCINPG